MIPSLATPLLRRTCSANFGSNTNMYYNMWALQITVGIVLTNFRSNNLLHSKCSPMKQSLHKTVKFLYRLAVVVGLTIWDLDGTVNMYMVYN